MNSFGRIVFLLLVSLSLIGCASPGQQTSSSSRFEEDLLWTEGMAVVRGVKGTVEVSHNGQEWQPATEDQKLEQGNWVRTGSGATADLDLGKYNGGTLNVLPDSVVRLEQIGRSRTDSNLLAIVDLQKGRVKGDTMELPPNTRILVKTPKGGYEIK